MCLTSRGHQNPKPSTPNPKPQTPNPTPQTQVRRSPQRARAARAASQWQRLCVCVCVCVCVCLCSCVCVCVCVAAVVVNHLLHVLLICLAYMSCLYVLLICLAHMSCSYVLLIHLVVNQVVVNHLFASTRPRNLRESWADEDDGLFQHLLAHLHPSPHLHHLIQSFAQQHLRGDDYVAAHWRRGDRGHPEMGAYGQSMWQLSEPDIFACNLNRMLARERAQVANLNPLHAMVPNLNPFVCNVNRMLARECGHWRCL